MIVEQLFMLLVVVGFPILFLVLILLGLNNRRRLEEIEKKMDYLLERK
ncbi:hypothetical protein SAMN05421687_104233 [Salimicrobium flavidum]|uniref:Uncharacterized protein n=1 Tax=Salimicrobium flavidum TaxID=570947 RepID=A0A1N7J9X8_9BACI|nr:hypothetical protein SAMN05421687_104233 [Salimicrobium flavidum]